MAYVMICLLALAASGLTFFSGFGLGTLLLPAIAAAVVAALAGALLGKRWLAGMTMDTVQRIVAILLMLVAAGLVSGVV
jgi:uncharacterized membrane protein YfcA